MLLTHARASSVKKSRVNPVPSGHQATSTAKDSELEIRGHGVAFPRKRKYDSLFARLKSAEEEIIAAEGTYEEIIAIDRSGSDQGSPGMGQKATRNASFSHPSKGSFSEQVVDALFDQIWSDVSTILI